MSERINIHIENIVLEGFSKKEGIQIIESFKKSLVQKIESGSAISNRDTYMSAISAKPLLVSNKSTSSDIGRQASESIFNSINS